MTPTASTLEIAPVSAPVHPLIGRAARMEWRQWCDADSAYMLGITDEEFASLKAEPEYAAECQRVRDERRRYLEHQNRIADDPRTRPGARSRALKAVMNLNRPVAPDAAYALSCPGSPGPLKRGVSRRRFERYWMEI